MPKTRCRKRRPPRGNGKNSLSRSARKSSAETSGFAWVGVFGAIAPGLGLEAAHVELASRDAELAAKHEFFVGDHSAGVGLDPVGAAVVGDVDDLLAKTDIGSYL